MANRWMWDRACFTSEGEQAKTIGGAILQSADMPIEHMMLSGRELAEMFVLRKF